MDYRIRRKSNKITEITQMNCVAANSDGDSKQLTCTISSYCERQLRTLIKVSIQYYCIHNRQNKLELDIETEIVDCTLIS